MSTPSAIVATAFQMAVATALSSTARWQRLAVTRGVSSQNPGEMDFRVCSFPIHGAKSIFQSTIGFSVPLIGVSTQKDEDSMRWVCSLDSLVAGRKL